MNLVKCVVDNKVIFLDKAITINTEKRTFSLFKMANQVFKEDSVNIKDSDNFTRKEVS